MAIFAMLENVGKFHGYHRKHRNEKYNGKQWISGGGQYTSIYALHIMHIMQVIEIFARRTQWTASIESRSILSDKQYADIANVLQFLMVTSASFHSGQDARTIFPSKHLTL